MDIWLIKMCLAYHIVNASWMLQPKEGPQCRDFSVPVMEVLFLLIPRPSFGWILKPVSTKQEEVAQEI